MILKSTFLFMIALLTASLAKAEAPCEQSPGALILAHGSHKSHHHHHEGSPDSHESHESSLLVAADPWNDTIVSAVEAVKARSSIPVELAFGMWDKESFEEGVQKLALKGVCELRIIPLFINSQSEVIDVQKYMFGVSDKISFPISVGKVHLPSSIKHVKFGKALDDHEVVSEILYERLTQISHTPSREGVLFVAHGPFGDDYEPYWLEVLKIHGERIQKKYFKTNNEVFYEFSYFTLRDDSLPLTRNQRTQDLRNKVAALNKQSITPIVIPVLITEGGIEKGIIERLEGLDYKIQTQFLMPHPKMIDWLMVRVNHP